MYFENNNSSLINILRCAEEFKIPHFVFSSSCTVYGNPDEIPVTEDTPYKPAESPYGYTKQMGENIVKHTVNSNHIQSVLLRYFNPVGSHPSIEIGEIPIGKPANLIPAITQTAAGKLEEMKVFGNKYPTKDGTCIRDYIHVSDIAHAHTLALNYLKENKNTTNCDVFNLGSGTGYSVLEVIATFEKVSGKKLNFSFAPIRPGDVVAIYANNEKAKKILGWNLKYDLDAMMHTAWEWELKLQKDQNMFGGKNAVLN